LEHWLKLDDKEIMAHWTYSRQEWRTFQKWKELRKSMFHYMLHWLKPHRAKPVAEIKITAGKVWFDDIQETFHDHTRHFLKINIHDAGMLNVMEISYEQYDVYEEIMIPIPKGKLREAIYLQDILMKTKLSAV
jgi:hypothetical protein